MVLSWQLNFSARFSCMWGVIYMIFCTVPRPQSLSSLHCAGCRISPNNQTVLALLSFPSAKWLPYSSAWCHSSRKSTLAGGERAVTAGEVLSSPLSWRNITHNNSWLSAPHPVLLLSNPSYCRGIWQPNLSFTLTLDFFFYRSTLLATWIMVWEWCHWAHRMKIACFKIKMPVRQVQIARSGKYF